MKNQISIFLIFKFAFLLVHFNADAQISKDSIHSYSFQNAPLTEVLSKFKRDFDVKFAYDAGSIGEFSVSIDIVDANLNTALDAVLTPFSLGYRSVGKVIVIIPLTPKEVPQEETLPIIRLYQVSGVVEDHETGEPLPFANVRLSSGEVNTQCDIRGQFLLKDLISDSLIFTFSYVGYEEKSVSVIEMRRQKKPVVSLQPRRFFLPTAVVESKGLALFEAGEEIGLQTLNPLDISNVNGPGQPDIMRAAQLLPGINATNETSNGLIIRGSGGDQNLLTIDGFTIYHMDHFFGLLSAINPVAVKNMRIHKSPGPAALESRVGGSVEITAKEGSRYAPALRLDMGPLHWGVMLESPLGNKQRASMMVAARRSITDIIQTPAYKSLFGTIYAGGIGNDATDAYKQADYAFNDLIAKATWRPNDRSLFYLSLYSSNDDLIIDYRTSDQSNNFQYQFSDVSSWGNRGLGAGWERKVRDDLGVKLMLGASSFSSELFAVDSLMDLRDNEIIREFRSDQNTLRDFSLENDWEWKRNNGSISFGGQWKNLIIKRLLNDESVDGSDSSRAEMFAFFVQREWRIKLHQLNVGGRFNFFNATGKWYPEWRVNYNYAVSSKWKWKASSSLTYQFVHRTLEQRLFQNLPDIWMISDGENLPVMSAMQWSLGTLYKSNGWTLDSEVYYKKLTNQAVDQAQWAFFTTIDVPYLIGDGYATGIDVMVAKDWKDHHVSISYSLAKTRFEYPDLDQVNMVAPSYDQLHELKMYYEFKYKQWDASAIWVYGSGRPYTLFYGFYESAVPGSSAVQIPIYGEINGHRLTSYHRLDLSMGYTWPQKHIIWEFRTGCYNIYNQRNVRDVQYLSYPTNSGDFAVEKRNVIMLGRVPSIQVTMTLR